MPNPMTRPESIENRWDILYRDYPEVYEAFSQTPYRPTVFEQLPALLDLRGKTIADVGAGTGSSTLALARYARRVIGVEREAAMLRLALDKAGLTTGAEELPQADELPQAETGQVRFVSGDALALPLAHRSVDYVAGITLALYPPAQYRDFIREGLRTARQAVVYLGIPPGWYGGDLYDVIEDFEKVDDEIDRIFLDEFHADYHDLDTIQDYGTLEHITSTYGFIFGKKTIEHLRRENKTWIHWRFRAYLLNV